MGRRRRTPSAWRSTTCWLVSTCTRTDSTVHGTSTSQAYPEDHPGKHHSDTAALAETESTLIAPPSKDEEQQYSRDEAEDVSEVSDVLRGPMPREAQLSDPVDRLHDDEETDQHERGQLHDRDEDPEEDQRRDARGREGNEIGAEHAG